MSTTDERQLSYLEDLLARVRLVSKATSDLATSRALGAVKSSIPQWRKRGTVPHAKLVEWALREGVDLNWLFSGTGEPFLDDGLREHQGEYNAKAKPKPCKVDYKLLGQVTEIVHDVIGDASGWRRVGEVAGRMYMDVVEFGDQERAAALKMGRRWLAWKLAERGEGEDSA